LDEFLNKKKLMKKFFVISIIIIIIIIIISIYVNNDKKPKEKIKKKYFVTIVKNQNIEKFQKLFKSFKKYMKIEGRKLIQIEINKTPPKELEDKITINYHNNRIKKMIIYSKTMKKATILYQVSKILKKECDYLYYININSELINEVKEEIIGNWMSVLHPNNLYYNGNEITGKDEQNVVIKSGYEKGKYLNYKKTRIPGEDKEYEIITDSPYIM
jgi:hypothetical protein